MNLPVPSSHKVELDRRLKNLTAGRSRKLSLAEFNRTIAKVVQDVETRERKRKCISMLCLLAMGEKDVENGRITPLKDAFKEVRGRIRTSN